LEDETPFIYDWPKGRRPRLRPLDSGALNIWAAGPTWCPRQFYPGPLDPWPCKLNPCAAQWPDGVNPVCRLHPKHPNTGELTMPYVLGAVSRANLKGVHPDLVRVVERAISISKIDFKVIEGVRSRERMMENYGKGRTAAQLAAKGIPAKYARPSVAKVTWLADPFNSKHAVQKDGYGHAVDCLIAPYDWKEGPGWRLMYDAFMEAARIEKVRVRWGRDWDEDGVIGEKGETDGPHFELVR
jgi:peptidoglycan L-alanyl-D-glutamate endopeptidase CwlK